MIRSSPKVTIAINCRSTTVDTSIGYLLSSIFSTAVRYQLCQLLNPAVNFISPPPFHCNNISQHEKKLSKSLTLIVNHNIKKKKNNATIGILKVQRFHLILMAAFCVPWHVKNRMICVFLLGTKISSAS